MEFGMMWFDDNPKTTLADKLERAIHYYSQKYGHTPDVCFVNPSMLKEPLKQANNITIRPYRSILPCHFWIGLEDQMS
jgi:hypothetical protein